MARETNFDKDSNIFIGEDKQIRFPVYDDDNDGIPLDVSGYAMTWILRKKDTASDPALLTKTTGAGITVTGTFDVDPDVNTQRVVVTLADTDMATDLGVVIIPPLKYRYSLKRTDAGSETILAFGNFVLREATARA